MNIHFKSLQETDFPLLLKWLNTPHVKTWWDQNVHWTSDLIWQKYNEYVKGFKTENGELKPIKAYIIYIDTIPAGYIQIYNAYDFARSAQLTGLPASLAAFDLYIGEVAYLHKGLGNRIIDMFLNEYAKSYTHVFTDPDNANIPAIRAYEKAGFIKASIQPVPGEVWMIRDQIKKLSVNGVTELLNDLAQKINTLYGYVSIPGDNFGEPAINSGPCGPFANAFYTLWNQKFTEKVHIVFIMVKNSDECWHVAIRLPNGLIFDGGLGVHDELMYKDKFDIIEMPDYDLQLLEKHSGGLNRKYPRYCPNFSIGQVEELISKYLDLILEKEYRHK